MNLTESENRTLRVYSRVTTVYVSGIEATERGARFYFREEDQQ